MIHLCHPTIDELTPSLINTSRLRSIFATCTIYATCAFEVRPLLLVCDHFSPQRPEHNSVGALKGRNSEGPGMPQSLSMNLVLLLDRKSFGCS